MNEKCLFCQIVNHEQPAFILAANEKALAILDAFPVSDGHVLLISRQHFANLTEVDAGSWNYFLPLIKSIIAKLQANFPVRGFNIISNVGEMAYQSIFHLHLHIIPKYEKNQGFIGSSQPQLKYSLTATAQKLK